MSKPATPITISPMIASLTEPQTARACIKAGRIFEAEATVTVSPIGLLAFGGAAAMVLLAVVPIIGASRARIAPADAPRLP